MGLSAPDSLTEAIARLVDGESLGTPGAAAALEHILAGDPAPEQVAGFLVALAAKGPTVEELVGLLDAMDAHVVALELDDDLLERAVDIVGTGGDGAGTVNLSTAASLVVAGAGVPVVKHGSRKASSAAGSADVLEALGLALAPGAPSVARSVREAGFGFCFAPAFHPALGKVAPVRSALRVRTVFNYLGPMANPARVRHVLLGVADPRLLGVMSEVVALRGARHVLGVRGHDGLDELSLCDSSDTVEIRRHADGALDRCDAVLDPRALGFELVGPDRLRGGDARDNAALIRAVLDGEQGPIRDAVRLNAAAALVAANAASGLDEGVALATQSIDSGSARRALDAAIRISHEQR